MAKEIQTEVAYLLQLGPNIVKEVYLVSEVKDIDMVKNHVRQVQEIFGVGGVFPERYSQIKVYEQRGERVYEGALYSYRCGRIG